jgi:RNA-directed DNA polymerase
VVPFSLAKTPLTGPIFYDHTQPTSYGYRPQRSAQDAIKEVHTRICQGYTEVVDADLSRYFDTIPHRELMLSVALRISDRYILALIKRWLKTPVVEVYDKGRRQLAGGKRSKCGTPQGGVISPLLANLYMNRFLKYWRLTRMGEKLKAVVVDYTDDFVILSRYRAREALAWTRQVMHRLGLALNEAKTAS